MARPAAALQHLRVDPRAVVTDPQPQLPPRIGQLQLDLRRLGGMKRVDERLPSHPVHLLSHHDVKRPRPPLDDDLQLRASVLGELASGLTEGVHDLDTVAVPGPKSLNQAPSLAHGLVGTIEGLVHQRSRRLGRGDPVGDRLELEDEAIEPLEQRVVHLTGDPLPLRKPGLHPGLGRCCQLAKAQQIQHPNDGDGDRRDPRPKPDGLVVGGRNGELQRGA